MTTIHWKTGADGDWSTAASWDAAKVPLANDDAIIDAAGAYGVDISTAQSVHSLTIGDTMATVNDNAALTLAGGALSVVAGVFNLNSGGMVVGGTLSATGGTFGWKGGTLSGVTYEGVLDLSGNSSVVVSNGLKLTGVGGKGPGTINLTGDEATLYIAGTETLDNATLNIGSNYLPIVELQGSGNVMTLGSQFNIIQTGDQAIFIDDGDNTIVNNGTISTALADGIMQIAPSNFTNNGVISAVNSNVAVEGARAVVNHAKGVISVIGKGASLVFGNAKPPGCSKRGDYQSFGAGALGNIGTDAATVSNTGTISMASPQGPRSLSGRRWNWWLDQHRLHSDGGGCTT